jgi:hypothetical protein
MREAGVKKKPLTLTISKKRFIFSAKGGKRLENGLTSCYIPP